MVIRQIYYQLKEKLLQIYKLKENYIKQQIKKNQINNKMKYSNNISLIFIDILLLV